MPDETALIRRDVITKPAEFDPETDYGSCLFVGGPRHGEKHDVPTRAKVWQFAEPQVTIPPVCSWEPCQQQASSKFHCVTYIRSAWNQMKFVRTEE